MKSAFTLAEVLITLGIIGVVAAMTIPTLISNTRSQQYRSTLKKTVSTLSQAAKMSQAQYGFDYAGITKPCGNAGASEHPETDMTICGLLNGTLTGATYFDKASEIKIKKAGKEENYSFIGGVGLYNGRHLASSYHAYVLSDGVIVGIWRGLGTNNGCSRPVGSIYGTSDGYLQGTALCWGFIDVNGVSLPNKEVNCSSGTNSMKKNDCVVKNDSKHLTDIFPIRFHDGIVEPETAAGRYVLQTAK